jgi:superfamily I DNA and/or RNA helicase
VARALSAQDYHLIQGPPGTGKTSGVLRCLVTQCLRQGEHVVVAAFTNRAVDEIERRLEENGLPFVRLGRPGGMNAFERAQSIRQGSLFVTTVAKLLQQHDQLLSLHRRIDTLIVDEASQVLEPQLIHLAAAVGRTVFIGDHCQLPPIVTQPARTTRISETSELRAHGFSDLRLTLFERLWRRCESMGWTSAFGMLEEHFRMHEQVAALVNENYGGKLRASTEAQRQEIRIFRPDAEAPLERLMARLRTIFVSMSAAMGRGSAEEAGFIASLATLVRRAYGDRFNAETLGVVTPWRVQINEIRKALDPELLELVTVDTVERFQGMERDVIVISLAVGNRMHVERAQSLTLEEDGRLPVDRKLNVALSRARSHVIILGHEPVLLAAPQYRRLIDQIRRLGGYVENTEGLMGREAGQS